MTIPKVRYLILPKMKKWLLMVLLFPLCCTLQARLHAEAGTGAGCRSQAASVLYGTLPQHVAAFTTDFKNMPTGSTDARPASPRLSVPDMHPTGGEAAIPGGLACWAWVLCAVVLLAAVAMLVRLAVLKWQHRILEEKIRFFIDTAHDIRTPLSLIKAPLEELAEKETLSKEGTGNLHVALRNVQALNRLTSHLIQLEQADVAARLSVSEYELNSYMSELCSALQPHARARHRAVAYESDFPYLNVWLDKGKMDAILSNLLAYALKRVPEGSALKMTVSSGRDFWHVKVQGAEISAPGSTRKRWIRSRSGEGGVSEPRGKWSSVGLLLVWQLARIHKGKMRVRNARGGEWSVELSFPKGRKRFRKVQAVAEEPAATALTGKTHVADAATEAEQLAATRAPSRQRILVVEENSDLRAYLWRTLSDRYAVQACRTGREAWVIIPEFKPDLVITDAAVSGISGEELCTAVKSHIETSHIPVVLLTALGNEKAILAGLQMGADEYIVKPFSVRILKAAVANLLKNRALLKEKYARLALSSEVQEEDTFDYSQDIDWQFIANVRKLVESHLGNPSFNVDTLCSLVGMSRTSFYNKLRALTSQAPGDYIRLIRLKRAAELLKEGKHNVAEVAEMTGFSDAKYFREVFKKYFKESPSQYGKSK